MVFTEGWSLFRADPSLERVTSDGRVPTADPARVDPRTGGIARQGDDDPRSGTAMSLEQCDRLRTMLAYSDHEMEFRQLLQRANRANVSFYPIDARGLVVFDTPIDATGTVVNGRIPHVIPATEWNRFYLETKASRSGHQIDLEARPHFPEQDDPVIVEDQG